MSVRPRYEAVQGRDRFELGGEERNILRVRESNRNTSVVQSVALSNFTNLVPRNNTRLLNWSMYFVFNMPFTNAGGRFRVRLNMRAIVGHKTSTTQNECRTSRVWLMQIPPNRHCKSLNNFSIGLPPKEWINRQLFTVL
jgi:hypothetical protein